MSKFIANSFQVPNAFIDEMLFKLSGNACKIYLLIVRKTRGWHKEADRISYSQIQKYTGINHRATISKALDELLELGLIFVQKGNEKSMSEYRLNDDLTGSKNEPVKNCTSSKNEPTGSKNEQEAGSKNEHTEIQYIKNTNTKDKSEYDTHTHENTHEYEHQTFQNLQGLQQTKKTAKKTNVFIGVDELINLGVDEQVANDFLAIRKTKLTKTALNGIIKQSDLANISLAQALEFICEMGWQSFKAQWYFNSINSNKSDNSKSVISQLQEMANNNPTNIYIDDLPNGDYLGVTYE